MIGIYIFIIISGLNFYPETEIMMLEGNYSWIDKDSVMTIDLKLKEEKVFEFVIDNRYDCTRAYVYYGTGEYSLKTDVVQLNFELISGEKSECQIDSTVNVDRYSELQIKVNDQDGDPIDDVRLSWAKPEKRGRKTRTLFFEKRFDKFTEIQFLDDEKIHFVRVEKEDYYWQEIKLPSNPDKDYKAEIILRPKPQVGSENYISQEQWKLPIISECELELQEEIKLKRKSCH